MVVVKTLELFDKVASPFDSESLLHVRPVALARAGELKRAKADHAELRRVRFYRLGWQDLVLRADKLDASNAPLKKVGVKQPVAAGAARG